MIRHIDNAIINGQYIRDAGVGYPSKTESIVIPTGAPYQMELDEVISRSSTIVAMLNDAPAEVLPWDFVPMIGQIAVHRARGLVKYSSDNEGNTLSVTYDPAGTLITVSKLVQLLGA